MVVVKNPEEYKLMGFERSHLKYKKYNAILKNKKTGKIKKVPFGSSLYQQYKDSTGLNLYSDLDHNDPDRRRKYRQRHQKDMKNKFSSGYFSWHYLW